MYLKNIIHNIECLLEAQIVRHTGSEQIEYCECETPDDGSFLNEYVKNYNIHPSEAMVMILALIPIIYPQLLNDVLGRHKALSAHFPLFGGARGKHHHGILPTGETAQFLLGGNNMALRLGVANMLSARGRLQQLSVLKIGPVEPGEPPMAGRLILDPAWQEQVLTGHISPPTFSPTFPAQQLTTDLNWQDLILPKKTLAEITYLRNYLTHQEKLAADPGYGRHSRRGYRALFHGPPGTGKTLTAALLGKATDRPVFRVDLSMVVSKWIGETEKNLAGLFERAESKGWILFFDEADSLFSKRGEVKESRDKYANQETSFLLQRVENYDGLCILASNFRQNMDKAFTRRFESMVAFSLPDAGERYLLWRNILPDRLPVAEQVDVKQLADRYELTGASIANAVRHCVYETTATGSAMIEHDLLLVAIRREYEKEDRLLPAG